MLETETVCVKTAMIDTPSTRTQHSGWGCLAAQCPTRPVSCLIKFLLRGGPWPCCVNPKVTATDIAADNLAMPFQP